MTINNDKNYENMLKGMKSLHRIPRKALRKEFIRMAVVLTAPIRQSYWKPLQDKIEELTNEVFLSTATTYDGINGIAKSLGYTDNQFVGGCRLGAAGEAIYDGK